MIKDTIFLTLAASVLLLLVTILMTVPFYLCWNNGVVYAVSVAKPITLVQSFWMTLITGFIRNNTTTSKDK